ncbi:hypothetical protein [Streptomyces sp. NPDC048269]|uniref:hypothetical protein n=1 Tax=Streptomyces sp. NPDC048269 TaxID=3155753 RepID=UPI003438B2FB
MKQTRKWLSGALVGGLAVVGMMATAPSAAAVGGCPAGKLCLYEDIHYVDVDLTSTRTKACFYLWEFGEDEFASGIGSYVNNLPVKADVYHWDGRNLVYVHDGTIRPGGSSSNSRTGSWFGHSGKVCTGGATS